MIKQIIRLAAPGVFLPYFAIESAIMEKVLIRPTYMSICAADQRYFCGDRPESVLKTKLPMALIHEAIGQVLYSKSKFSQGDNVILIPFNHPLHTSGANYLEKSHFHSSTDDGFTQETLVLPPKQLIKIETDNDLSLFALSELMSVCCHAIRMFITIKKHNAGDIIGVWGDGSMAYMVSLALKFLLPKNPVIVVGKHDSKLQLFTFVDDIKNFTCPSPLFRVHHAFECVGGGGAQTAINHICKSISPEGIVMLLGVSEVPPTLNTRLVLEKGLIFRGCSRSTYKDFQVASELLHRPSILEKLQLLISQESTVNNPCDLENAFITDKQVHFKTLINWNI